MVGFEREKRVSSSRDRSTEIDSPRGCGGQDDRWRVRWKREMRRRRGEEEEVELTDPKSPASLEALLHPAPSCSVHSERLPLLFELNSPSQTKEEAKEVNNLESDDSASISTGPPPSLLRPGSSTHDDLPRTKSYLL